jgi:hypothetical protein
MKQRIGTVLLMLFLLMAGQLSAQKEYPKNYFRSPVNYPITLSGSFGEIRRNHFHSGIDIRTAGAVGKPVYAVADGYVSRVNISATGFGKALYINHPNGYTSLYGHLLKFAGPIAQWVRAEHYRRESFVMDTEVPAGVLKVKKGDLIAYSGNSGSSGGPHIHFEIRDTKSQEIIDPFDFGFMTPERTPPRITFVKIYPFDRQAMVNFKNSAVLLPVTGGAGKFGLKLPDTLKVSGNILFGIETSDDAAEGSLKTGVHIIELSIDGERIFSQDIDRFAFAETRYVNSLIDYPAYVANKRKIQRSYVAPNNRLSVYDGVKDRGVVHFHDEKTHTVRYVVRDAFGNTSELVFRVKSHPPAGVGARPQPGTDDVLPAGTTLMVCGKENRFEREGLRFILPAEVLYEDLSFKFSETAPVPGSYAPVYHLHDRYTPLHTFCTLSIKPTRLPAKLQPKALVVTVGSNGKFASAGGKFEDGWVTTRIRDFGNYTIAVDTVAPVIKAVNIFAGKKVVKQSTIQMRISDNLSGISSYKGTLNGKWILMDYDAKSSTLTYAFDDRLKAGKNSFVLTVTDAVGNQTRYSAAIIR